MRALTNGEGEEEEAAASAGASPGLGRKRRRAEQRGGERARAAEAWGAGRARGVLRHDPQAQPGRANLRSSAQVAAPAAKAAVYTWALRDIRSPSLFSIFFSRHAGIRRGFRVLLSLSRSACALSLALALSL